jgi:hypothetical protein
MPSRPLANSAVRDFLGTKVAGDNLLLLGSPTFLDRGIIIIRLGHRSTRFFEGRNDPYTTSERPCSATAAGIARSDGKVTEKLHEPGNCPPGRRFAAPPWLDHIIPIDDDCKSSLPPLSDLPKTQ